MTDEDRFLRDLCPLCGSHVAFIVREGEDLLFPDGIRYAALRCDRCKVWFTRGSDFASLSAFYGRSYPEAYYEVFSGGRNGDRGSNPLVAKVVANAVPRTSTVLDIGAGNGGFPNYLRSLGFDAEGLELSFVASEYARSTYGLRMFNGPVEELPRENIYDVITMVGTVEHLLNPVRTLGIVREHLTARGRLIFDFPVADCVESRIAREKWWGLDLPRHTVHLTRSSARMLAELSGFRVIHMQSVATTWFHYGFVHPPAPTGVSRNSPVGLMYQGIAAALRLSRRSPLTIALCEVI